MIDIAIIQHCAPAVHPFVMQRIMQIETQHKPNAIGFRILKNNKDYRLPNQPKTFEEAKYTANWLYQNGYRYDLGIAQINSANFRRFGVTPDDMFDMCKNLNIASKILTEFYISAKQRTGNEQQALRYAISAYNSGKYNSPAGQNYYAKVSRVDIKYE
jgi:type IV secretion system protein VirB1